MPSISLLVVLASVASTNPAVSATAVEPHAEEVTPPVILAVVQQEIDTALRDINRAAEASARAVELATGGEGEVRQILALVATHDPSILDCAWIDAKGNVRWTEPAPERPAGMAEAIPREAFPQVRDTREPILGACAVPDAPIAAVDLEYPAFASDDHLIGAVSIVFDPAGLLQRIVQGKVRGSEWEIWVADASGRLIHGPSPAPRIEALLQQMGDAPRGRCRIEPGTNGADGTGSREVYWTTVALHDAAWRVIASRPLDRG